MPNADLAAAQVQRRTRKRQSRAQAAAARRAPVGSGVLAPGSTQRRDVKPPSLFRSAPTVTSLKTDSERKLKRAIVALPKTPTPAIPTIRNPSRQQQGAAGRLIAAAQERARGGKTGSAGLAAQRAYEQSIRQDPRQDQYRRAAQIYTAAATRDINRRAGKQIARRAGIRNISAADANRLGRAAVVRARRDQYRVLPKKSLAGGLLATATPAVLAAAGLDRGQGVAVRQFLGRVGGRAAGDVKTIATGPLVAGIELGRGVADVAGVGGAKVGDTRRLERLGKGVVKGAIDSAPGRLVRGDVRGAGEELIQHPVLGLLDAAGAVNAIGSVAGAGARLGRLEAGSRVRAPLVDSAGKILKERRHSADLTRAVVARARDKRAPHFKDAEGNTVLFDQRGKQVPGVIAKPRRAEREYKRIANADASRADAGNRLAREVEGDAATVPALDRRSAARLRVTGTESRSSKDLRDLAAMAAEGTVVSAKTLDRDLVRRRTQLAASLAEHERTGGVYRDRLEVARATDQLEMVSRVLGSPKLRRVAERVVDEGARIGRERNARELDVVDKRLGLTAKQAERRRLVPYAVTHMGARHVSVEEHARLESVAREREDAIRQVYEQAPEAERPAIKRELDRARADRIAVSGRDPKRVREYEDARDVTQRANREVAAAKEKLRRARLAKVGVTDPDRLVVLSRREGEAQQALKVAKAERARVRPVVKRGLPEAKPAIRRGDGRQLTTKEIREAIRADGRDPESVAYLPHFARDSGLAYRAEFRPGTRPSLTKEATTGEAYRRGSAPRASAELLREQGARQGTQLNKARFLDEMVRDHGRAKPDGSYWTMKDAEELGARLENDDSSGSDRALLIMPNGEQLVPVRAYAAKLDKESQRIIREDLQGPGGTDSLASRLMNSRFLQEGEMERAKRADNVVLMPKAYVDQLVKHLQPSSEAKRLFQLINRPFRMAVLAQPKWLFGNIVEPYIVRLTAEGSGLNVFGLGADVRAYRAAMRTMERSGDPRVRQAARDIQAQQFGGLLSSRQGSVRRTPREALPPGLQRRYADLIERTPAVNTFAEVLGTIGDFLLKPARSFFVLNRYIEGGAQRAAFGRQIRNDIKDFNGSWLESVRLGKRAMNDVTKGLVNTSSQRRFMEAQQKLLGKYEGYGPRMREATQTIAPFLPWVLNASRFIFWTMPVEKTALTALLTQVNDVVAKEWAADHKDVPPGSLKYAIKRKDGGLVDVGRYTPYGFGAELTEGDFGGITGNVLPQAQGVLAALDGKDPFGRDLKLKPTAKNAQGKPSPGDKLAIALNQIFESSVPYASQARRLREGGSTGYANSNLLSPKVKPNTDTGSAVDRVYDPVRPTYLKGAPARGGKATGASAELPGGLSVKDLQDLTGAAAEAQGSALSPQDLKDLVALQLGG